MAKPKGETRTAKEGFALLLAPDGVTAASVDGVAYVVEDGVVEVDEAAVPALVEHGFVAAE